MPVFKAPLEDMRFLLNDVYNMPVLWQQMSGTQEVSADLADAILEEGAKLVENVVFPLLRSGDEEGCSVSNGVVTTPKGFREAFATFAAGGWQGLAGDPAYGGQGMPKVLSLLFEEMLMGVNASFALCPTLSAGAALAILKHAPEALRSTYLPPIYEGRWSGTMNLTEPHSGTDLGIIRSKAVPNGDGSYAVTGTKIFITSGEHDLTENIIHLVLAKLPDAPAGNRGISLFLVPKFLVQDDGSLGERNTLIASSLEHKMGIKASPTCVMNFDGAKGWLVGEENNGLACMFTMMNYERLGIGIQGLGAAEVAYQNAVHYAKDRLQGRAAAGAVAPEKMADPIIVHPDVRRMLMTVRAFNEGGRAFAMYVAQNLDVAKFHDDADTRAHAESLAQLLTPLAKAFVSDRGFDGCVMAQQCFGGHGYVREWGMEQLVRDTRIAQIYEGTNGVQALDLAGRKLTRDKARMYALFMAEMRATAEQSEGNEFHADFIDALHTLDTATQQLMQRAATNPDEAGAASVDYLELFGLVAYGWAWLLMTNAVASRDDAFAEGKRHTARFFFTRLLPKIAALEVSLSAGSGVMMAPPVSYF